MGEQKHEDHNSRTRFLRTVENISFSGHDVLGGIFSAVHPSLVSSINLLHGERKGVIRVTLKTTDALMELDQKLDSRKVSINGMRVAAVGEYGQFLRVTLMDVPDYLTSIDIERELREYGTVVYVKREYIDYRGHKIENETRQVLFSTFHRDIPSRIDIDGNLVFVSYKSPLRSRGGETGNGSRPFPTSMSRPLSRQAAVGTHSSAAERETMVNNRPSRPSSRTGPARAASPIVTPETEKLPEIGNTRPRHIMANPQPYRRNSIQVPLKSSMDSSSSPRAGPSHYNVEVQVEEPQRQEACDDGSRGWASGYTVPPGRRYYDSTDTGPRITHLDHDYFSQKSEDYETKI